MTSGSLASKDAAGEAGHDTKYKEGTILGGF